MSEQKCEKKVKLWQSQTEYECQEPTLSGNPYCILHSEDENKNMENFKQKVEERMTPREDEIDLRGCYFSKGFDRNYFKDRVFHEFVDFSGAVFSHETSFAVAKFLQAEFRERVDFLKTVFEGQKTNFREAKFKGDANFWDTQFKCEEVSFTDTEFSEEGEVKFDASHFNCQVYFIKTKFNKLCKFWWNEFPTHKQAVFEHADLSNCSFLYTNIDKVDFRYCEFGDNYREDDVIFSILRRPLPTEIKERIHKRVIRRLFYCLYLPFLRTAVLKDERDCDKKVTENPKDKKARKEYEYVRRLYLELKRNFEDKKDWNTAGDFHYGEMECRRKKKETPLGRWFFSLEALYFWASGYGERPLRAFVVLLLLILGIFPLLYMYFSHDSYLACIWESVNVATFMRIEKPDVSDTLCGKFLLALESILVPFQGVFFALALRRKVKR